VDTLAMLQRGISERQRELQHTADILAKRAEEYGRISTVGKISLVVLGALTASKAAADQLIGSSSAGSIVFYALVGVLTAMIAGLEAALRFDRRSTELTILAAECQAFIRKVDSEWYKRIGAAREDERVEGATALLDLQDEKLAEIQEKASKAGLNITFSVRSLDRMGEEEAGKEEEAAEEEDTRRQAYRA
jgi:hypothetical protein